MNHKSIRNQYEYLSWTEISNVAMQKRSTIIWPFGAVEQHGPHLPLATDSIFVDEIVNDVLKILPDGLPILKIPTQYIGFSPEHLSFELIVQHFYLAFLFLRNLYLIFHFLIHNLFVELKAIYQH